MTSSGTWTDIRSKRSRHRPSGPSDTDFRGFEWRHYWNRTAGDATVVFRGDEGIRAIALNPSRTRFAAGGDDGTIRLFRLADFQPIREFATGQIEAWDLAFFDDRQLVCGGADGTVAVYDVATGESLDRHRVAETRQVGIAVTETPRG